MNKDLYEILGLQKGASDADIKKAFRKLSMQYHPDRQAGKSDKEKKEAEEKFKEISGAWTVLSDPEKKRQYDMFGTIDGDSFGGGDFDFTGMFGDLFGSMFGNSNRRYSYQTPKGQTVQVRMGVSIQEILNDKIDKEIEYDIEVRCPDCKGAGGEGIQTCPYCRGTGMITETQRTAFGIMQQQRPCNHCHGSGRTMSKKCNHCHGEGTIKKRVRTRVTATGLRAGQTLVISGKGYESKDSRMPNGDLHVILIFQHDQNRFVVQDTAIYEKIDVSYYDCILGNTISHTYANGRKSDIAIPAYSNDGKKIKSTLSFGKYQYYFIVSVKMPTYTSDSEKKLLEEIRKLHK